MGRSYLAIRHVAAEPLGLLDTALDRAECSYRYVEPWADEPIPDSVDDAHGLIVLGGPMGVYEAEQHPYLEQVMALIARTVEQGRPVLGICLGSQLLAGALGARVYPGSAGPEFGWGEITRAPEAADDRLFAELPECLSVVHWHGDTFDLPCGAVRLWSSPKYPNQAFRAGRSAYGLQFHLELTPEIVADWVGSTEAGVLERGGTNATTILAETPAHAARLTPTALRIFERWIAL